MKFKLIINNDDEEEIIAKVHSASELTAKIEDIVLSYIGNDGLTVHGDYELLTLRFQEIECITVIDRKVFVVDNKAKKYRTSGTLADIERSLPNYFIRINKSTIANERRISCYKTTFSGGVDAVFECGYKDYVSRRCFSEIKRRYKG
jgi:DNA-binding LytR/AlgR family response regulator